MLSGIYDQFCFVRKNQELFLKNYIKPWVIFRINQMINLANPSGPNLRLHVWYSYINLIQNVFNEMNLP